MAVETKYYRHSGKAPVAGITMAVIAGLVSVLILSLIYGYAIAYIPFIYLNFFITLGYGGILGMIIGIAATAGKIRNNKFALLTGLIFGVIAVYAGWVTWLYAMSEGEIEILSPSGITSAISMIAETGTWSIKGATPSGLVLEFIWLVEAIMIIGACTLASLAMMESDVFCEKCNKWAKEKFSFMPFEAVENPSTLKGELESGNFFSINLLKKVEDNSLKYSQYELTNCEGCNVMHLLTVSNVTHSIDKEGKKSTANDHIIQNLLVSTEIYNKIKAFKTV
jgi:hypothetical protein